MSTSTQAGVWVSATDAVLSYDYQIQSPGPMEVQIKNVYVASNPKDWKSPLHFPGYEGVEGNDIAGYISAIGEGVTRFNIGDKVGGFTKIRTAEKYGAYFQFSICPEWTTFHLGPTTKLEDAATVPLAYMTAAIGLFLKLQLPVKCISDPPASVLVNGASTTVGIFAIQLLKLSNFHVIGIAGAGADHARSYGCDVIVDYRNKTSEELSTAIEKASPHGRCHHVFDAISENGSYAAIGRALQSSGGGKIAVVLPQTFENGETEYSNIEVNRILVGKSHDEEKDFATEWYGYLGDWLESGKIRPQTVKIIPGGLSGVKEGLRMLKAMEVKCEKLVYKVSDTPGISEL